MDLNAILESVGLGVAGNAVFDFLKSRLSGTKTGNVQQLKADLQSVIDVTGVNMRAATVIDALARGGAIKIIDSHLYAPQGIKIGAIRGQSFFGGTSSSRTERTSIETRGRSSGIKVTGNMYIEQASDGSIRFMSGPNAGPNDSIGFYVSSENLNNRIAFGTGIPPKPKR